MRLFLLVLSICSVEAATLYSTVTGNFTAAGTWQVASAVASALLDSEAGSTACTTSYVYSATFTPAATNVTGVAVKLAARVASPTGTISITLANNTSAGTREGTTTINVADLPSSGNGWQMFQFGSAVAPNGTDVYKIGFKCSVNAEATLYRDGTAGNWSRAVMLVTTGAPAANDLLHITGLLTGQGTNTPVTVTMDQTATTSFGTTTPPQGFTVDNQGTLTWGTTASTAYALAHAGVFQCNGGGTVNIGSAAARTSTTPTHTWTITVASNVDSGIKRADGCTWTDQGGTMTVQTKLTADAAVAATVLHVTDTTGWLAGDVLAIGSTTRTASQAENKTILTVDSATQVTLTAGLTNAHSGTAPIAAFVGNITRSIKYTGTSSSLQGYIYNDTKATVTTNYSEYTFMGSGTANKRGIDIATTTGSSTHSNCSIHDFTVASSIGFNIGGSSSDNYTISNCVLYNNAAANANALTSGVAWVITGNLFIKSEGITLNDIGGTFTNNVISSNLTGIGTQITDSSLPLSFTGNTWQSNNNVGVQFPAMTCSTGVYTYGTFTIWRNINVGMYFPSSVNCFFVSGYTAFGNGLAGTSANMYLNNGPNSDITVNNFVSNGDSTFATNYGMYMNGAISNLKLNNGNFSTASGIKVAHANADIFFATTNYESVWANNTIMAVFTAANSALNTSQSGSFVAFANYGQTAADNRVYSTAGLAASDTTAGMFRTSAPSVRLTPRSAVNKLATGNIYIPIASGVSTATLSAYVRKSVVGDGAAYNGATPRLVILANPQAGSNYNSDYVCASGGGAGSFSQLSCTLPATTGASTLIGYVDCDGTAGWINVSDIAVSTTAPSLGNPTYFDRGFMSVPGVTSSSGGGSYTFVQ